MAPATDSVSRRRVVTAPQAALTGVAAAMLMRVWVLTALLCASCVGLGPVVEIKSDAGVLDASVAQGDAGAPGIESGVPDASVVDAGSLDAGDPDAGQAGAGSVVAGAADAGQADAGSVDAGAPDAGQADAGSVDAGAPDAGIPDAAVPQPERCDGIDNDFDGVIDRAADGGFLTMPCSLTLGVCAAHFSLCIDAGWAVCDYGALYESLERRCDGLDNDCDGRADISRRVRLEFDAGDYFPTPSPGVILTDSGIALSTHRALVLLNNDLSVRAIAQYPPTDNFGGTVIAHGGGYRRLFVDGTTLTLFVHAIGPNGEIARLADGGVEGMAITDHPVSDFAKFRLFSVGEDLFVAGHVGDQYAAAPRIEFRIDRVVDGGFVNVRSFADAGRFFYDAHQFDGGFFVLEPTQPLQIQSCASDFATCEPFSSIVTSNADYYFSFGNAPAPQVQTVSLNLTEGHLLTLAGEPIFTSYYPSSSVTTSQWIHAWRSQTDWFIPLFLSNVWPASSSALIQAGASFGRLTADGGVTVLDAFPRVANGGYEINATQVNGPLHLVVWVDALVAPGPRPSPGPKLVEHYAEFLCAP